MPCPQKRKALKVLLGELGGSASTKMLEHCRVCGECREAFDFAATTITKTTGASGASGTAIARMPAPHFADAPPDTSAPRAPYATRRNRRTLIIFGVVAFALLVAGVGKSRSEPATAPAAAVEARWKVAIGEGTPVVQTPAGTFGERPRVVTGLVPPGSSAFVLTFFDDAGRIALQSAAKPGDRGCFVEESDISAPSGTFRAGRFVAPFPDAAALPLSPGRSYGVVIAVAGGHASASSVFVTTPHSDALQDGAQEER